MGLAIFSILRLNRALLEPYVRPGRPVVEDVARHRRLRKGPRIVALGGGTGQSTLLRGLKERSSNLTAIVTVADDGGSSGRLRKSLGLPPPGDIRSCLAALSDDEELLTRTFSLLLQKHGYDVYVVKNGKDAIVMAEEEDFDVVICDIRMPGLNGVETIKAIRNSKGSTDKSDVPVIFITGFADEKVESDANALKPLAYLHKPFDNSDLLKIVEKGSSE